MDALYFAFGDTDVFLIADMPDNVSVAAASLTVAASGGAHVKTTVLMTAEEMDKAAKKTVKYRAPGQ